MKYSATEAAKIIAESGSAPEPWVAYAEMLRRQAREAVASIRGVEERRI